MENSLQRTLRRYNCGGIFRKIKSGNRIERTDYY